MNPASIIVLAFAMSTDAFAASVGKGAGLQHPRLGEALRAGLIFGVVEGVTPVIGWLLGNAASSYISAWDHWIAFVLLGILGARMLHAGLGPEPAGDERPARHGFWLLVLTAFATSIDAMIVGVSLAFLDVNIVPVAIVIGLATMLMTTIGIMLGRVLGTVFGRRAEIVGGLILIGIGLFILIEHLGAPA